MLVVDSVTQLQASAAGRVVIAASHGGLYAVHLGLRAAVKGLILSDAGVGLDAAGIAGLQLAGQHGLPCAAIDHRSARIGDGQDCASRGRIAHANALAQGLGISFGMHAREAAALMEAATLAPPRMPTTGLEESRRDISTQGLRPLVLIDSASLVRPEDAEAVLITGSHGGLLGGKPASALRHPVHAALFNDAGMGCEQAGIGRLWALNAQGIAASTVQAATARIGDAASAWATGRISHVNPSAHRLGARAGQSVQAWAERMRQWAS